MSRNVNDYDKEKQLLQAYFPFIQKDSEEMTDKLDKVVAFEQALQGLMTVCGDDAEREGVLETPYRMTKALLEYTEGYREDPKQHLEKTFDVPYQELVLVKDIEFYSMCEHHLTPFFGVASLTRSVALEESRNGITVNMVCPGDIKGTFKEMTIQEAKNQSIEGEKRSGSGEDLARTIVFLCEEQSDFITGNIIEVTGGQEILAKRNQME